MKQVDVLYFYVPKSLIFNGLPLKTFKTDLNCTRLGYCSTISSEFNFFVSAGLVITGYHTQADHFFRNYGLIHALNEWLEGKNIKFTRPECGRECPECGIIIVNNCTYKNFIFYISVKKTEVVIFRTDTRISQVSSFKVCLRNYELTGNG